MKILFLGDVVGKAGRVAVAHHLPKLVKHYAADLVVVNGENATHGFGISPDAAEELFRSSVDVITTGNHAFDRADSLNYFAVQERLIRPLNFHGLAPGAGMACGEMKNGKNFLVANVIGQLFMGSYDDPFSALDKIIGQNNPMLQGYDAIVVDVHAEATSEKQAIGYYLDGRVSLVVGTHTHVPTADTRLLEKGTAYQTDAGMCGCYDSVIGMEKTKVLKRFLKNYPLPRLEPASGVASLFGVVVETDDKTGLAVGIERLEIKAQDEQEIDRF
ncbi:MAG: TIGR00282 family metallophosphoesterase [Alphaproteobacteria bacterium]